MDIEFGRGRRARRLSGRACNGARAVLRTQPDGRLRAHVGYPGPPPPGFYVSALYVRYDGDRLRNASGASFFPEDIDPQLRPDLDVNAYGVGVVYITNAKLLGANVGFVVYPAWTDNKLEVPILGLSSKTPTGFTDLYFQSTLGWHRERADFIAGIGVFAPTGEYALGGSENRGLGMWSFEFFGGSDQTPQLVPPSISVTRC